MSVSISYTAFRPLHSSTRSRYERYKSRCAFQVCKLLVFDLDNHEATMDIKSIPVEYDDFKFEDELITISVSSNTLHESDSIYYLAVVNRFKYPPFILKVNVTGVPSSTATPRKDAAANAIEKASTEWSIDLTTQAKSLRIQG